jgi:hypothetical protein
MTKDVTEVAYQHQPSARDAGLTKVAALTVALSLAGVAGTAGIGMAIANAAPAPKKAGTDYSKTNGKANQAGGKGNTGGNTGKGGTTTKPTTGPSGTVAPPEDKPESSSGDEQTSSGGS